MAKFTHVIITQPQNHMWCVHAILVYVREKQTQALSLLNRASYSH